MVRNYEILCFLHTNDFTLYQTEVKFIQFSKDTKCWELFGKHVAALLIHATSNQ